MLHTRPVNKTGVETRSGLLLMPNMSRARNKSKMNSTTNQSLSFVDIFEERYYIINRRLLCFVGLWPYQSVFTRNSRTIFLAIASFTLMIPQTLQLIQSWGEASSFIECLSPLVTAVACDLKLVNSIFHIQKVKRLLDETRDDWRCRRNLPELKILHEHGEKGRRYTIAYLTLVYTAIVAWTSTPLIPIVMDKVAPLNESRPNIKFFEADYRVDPDKYFYPIFLHSSAVTGICMIIFVAVDTCYMVLAQHACAMLDILRYRLENMTEGHTEVSIGSNTNIQENFYYQQTVACMMKHKRSVEYIRVLEASCHWYLLIVIGFNMIVISCTGSQVVAINTTTEDVVRFTFFTVAQVVHLFCISLPGQWILDTSSLLPNSAYGCKWYLMPPGTQKLIVIFIRRSIQPCAITAGTMYVMSVENFSCVLKTSLSYLTLLTSMQ